MVLLFTVVDAIARSYPHGGCHARLGLMPLSCFRSNAHFQVYARRLYASSGVCRGDACNPYSKPPEPGNPTCSVVPAEAVQAERLYASITYTRMSPAPFARSFLFAVRRRDRLRVGGVQCRDRGIPDRSAAEGGYAAKARHGTPGASYDRSAERQTKPGKHSAAGGGSIKRAPTPYSPRHASSARWHPYRSIGRTGRSASRVLA
jgi:hypothetical protein